LAQWQLGVVSVFGVHACLPAYGGICRRPSRAGGGLVPDIRRDLRLEGGGIPTAAAERSACPRRVTGRGDHDGRLTLAACGRLPGGRIVRNVLTHSLRGRRTARSIRRGLEGGGGHGSKHEVREADTMAKRRGWRGSCLATSVISYGGRVGRALEAEDGRGIA